MSMLPKKRAARLRRRPCSAFGTIRANPEKGLFYRRNVSVVGTLRLLIICRHTSACRKPQQPTLRIKQLERSNEQLVLNICQLLESGFP